MLQFLWANKTDTSVEMHLRSTIGKAMCTDSEFNHWQYLRRWVRILHFWRLCKESLSSLGVGGESTRIVVFRLSFNDSKTLAPTPHKIAQDSAKKNVIYMNGSSLLCSQRQLQRASTLGTKLSSLMQVAPVFRRSHSFSLWPERACPPRPLRLRIVWFKVRSTGITHRMKSSV